MAALHHARPHRILCDAPVGWVLTHHLIATAPIGMICAAGAPHTALVRHVRSSFLFDRSKASAAEAAGNFLCWHKESHQRKCLLDKAALLEGDGALRLRLMHPTRATSAHAHGISWGAKRSALHRCRVRRVLRRSRRLASSSEMGRDGTSQRMRNRRGALRLRLMHPTRATSGSRAWSSVGCEAQRIAPSRGERATSAHRRATQQAGGQINGLQNHDGDLKRVWSHRSCIPTSHRNATRPPRAATPYLLLKSSTPMPVTLPCLTVTVTLRPSARYS